MDGWAAPWHWVILAILVIALFGYKRLPDAARSLGRSLRIFKTEMKGLSQDDAAREAGTAAPSAPLAAPPADPPPAQPPAEQAAQSEKAPSADSPSAS